MCSNLTEVTVLATTPPTAVANAKLFDADMDGNRIASLTAIKVPAGSVEDYKGAAGWITYADLIIGGAEPASAATIQKQDFTWQIVEIVDESPQRESSLTMPTDAPLADGEIWAWASFGPTTYGDDYRDAVWNDLKVLVGRPVGTANLLQVTNGMASADFGTFTSSPHNFSLTSGDNGMIIVVRARAADGTILAIGGVRNKWKLEGGTVTCENEMFGTGKIPVAYYAWDESAKDVVLKEPVEAIQLTDEITELEDGKWYVAIGRANVNREITVSGSAHLVLWRSSPTAHGAEISFLKKVTVGANAALSIYGMSKVVYGEDPNAGQVTFRWNDSSMEGMLNPTVDATGALNIHGAKVMVNAEHGNQLQCGTINVYGGILCAYAEGEKSAIRVGSALNVYGGWVFAEVYEGGTGAAIGGAAGQDGCTVNVYGGTVKARGGENAAGIGAGAGGTSHGDLHVAEGLNVWVAEDEESTKSLAPNYAETREQYVWVTTCSEKVKFQKFTATMGSSKITLKMPSAPGDGYRYAFSRCPSPALGMTLECSLICLALNSPRCC